MQHSGRLSGDLSVECAGDDCPPSGSEIKNVNFPYTSSWRVVGEVEEELTVFRFSVEFQYSPAARSSHSGCDENCPITGLDRRLGLQEVEAPRISRQSVHESGQVVSPTHRPLLPRREGFWYSFLLERESTQGATVRPEGLSH